MNYVGIKNWPEKARLLKSRDFEFSEAETNALIFDCERHLDFLKTFLEKGENFDPRQTLYYAFYDFLKGEKAGIDRSNQFLMLFKKVQTAGLRKEECVISVTTDGARLDGSHRGAIAMVLGIYQLPIKIFKWPDMGRTGHIQKEIRLKNEMHHAHRGFTAYKKNGHEYFGEVIYTDVLPLEKRSLFRRSYEFKPIVALRNGGRYQYIDQDKLTLKEIR